MNSKTSYIAKLVFSMSVFGTIGLFVRWVFVPSSIIALARGFIGAIFLIIFALIKKEKIDFSVVKENSLWLLLSGICIGFNWILLFESYRFTTVAVSTLCYYMQPIFILIASPILLKEKISFKKFLAIIIALIGMVGVAGIIENGIPKVCEAKGIIFGLSAGLLYAFVVIFNKKMTPIEATDKTIIQLLIASTVLTPYCLVTQNIGNISFSIRDIILILIVGTIHTGFSYRLYFSAIGHLPAQSAALLGYIDPVVAVILSTLLLKEPLSIFGWIGSVLIIGAAIYSEWNPPKNNKRCQN